MRNRASGTSQLVTMMRALAHAGFTEVRDFSDPTALPMLPPGWRAFTRFFLWSMARRPEARARMFEEARGSFDVVALRTRVFDEAWHDAHGAGMRQLVLLGAGLDGRAYRLDDVADSAVFEIDHPATQALKRARAKRLAPRAATHVFVPVDFERDRLEDALAASGHKPDAPTFWIWEGVTPYLTVQAQQATMDTVARRSAPGSRIAMTYVEPGGPKRSERLVRLFREPWIGLMTREEASRRLAQAGLRVLDDSGPADWQARFSSGPIRESELRERIAIAER